MIKMYNEYAIDLPSNWIYDTNYFDNCTMNSTIRNHVDDSDFVNNPKKNCLNLFNNNWSIKRISREYNLSPKQIVSYLSKNRIIERINTLYKRGIEYRDIAENIGLDL